MSVKTKVKSRIATLFETLREVKDREINDVVAQLLSEIEDHTITHTEQIPPYFLDMFSLDTIDEVAIFKIIADEETYKEWNWFYDKYRKIFWIAYIRTREFEKMRPKWFRELTLFHLQKLYERMVEQMADEEAVKFEKEVVSKIREILETIAKIGK